MVPDGHGHGSMFSGPFLWVMRFERMICIRTSAFTSSMVDSFSSFHGQLRSVPVNRYHLPLEWWLSIRVYDDLLLRTHLKGPQPSMGTIHPKYSTDSRNVSIEPRQQWLLHCRNTRSPKNRAEKKKRARRTRLRRSTHRYYSALLKAKNVVKDFHYKVSHSLLARHDTIICPTTTSHKWRQGPSLRSIVKRRILLLSFGSFARRLVQCATMYKNKTIVRGSEAYTSKQCGRCGTLQDKLGSSLLFTCGQCALESDRDIHAARNILLRFIE